MCRYLNWQISERYEIDWLHDYRHWQQLASLVAEQFRLHHSMSPNFVAFVSSALKIYTWPRILVGFYDRPRVKAKSLYPVWLSGGATFNISISLACSSYATSLQLQDKKSGPPKSTPILHFISSNGSAFSQLC